MDVDAVADELYRLDPSEFVAARTERVQQARKGGDRDAAKRIAAFKKPTVVGWAVNLLSAERSDEVDSVLSLGDALQRAQRRLDADTLRELTQQRQQLVRALAARAQGLARARGRELNENALREVSQTLHAAMADPELAEVVRRGRLLTAASYSGFGPVGLESVAAGGSSGGRTSAAAPRTSAEARNRTRAKKRERAAAELDAARAAARTAAAELSDAEEKLEAVRAEAGEVAERIEDLRAQLAHLGERAEFLGRSETSASRSVSAARDAVVEAQRRVSDAEDAVAELE
ncbi:hypothetical protein [Rhodococcus sp. SGAir0479]|uniref:hypothetical protein n=1 Tax=Rhodococcus sp. SGAir0479 TaxID=2567884 RepID=UPI0010CD253D|nr:hypothetical protein [Rhodococcus sp. SGAir0479]QCQ90357.1 hypothetical protein E7742_03405 [Rhodococcus sp. SGAir0479]